MVSLGSVGPSGSRSRVSLSTWKKGFVTATKLGTTNNFFLLLEPKILLTFC